MRRFLVLFASRDFRLLRAASTISLLGDGIWYIDGLMPVALAVVGPLADAFGARALLVATGFGGALLVLSFLLVPGVLAGEELRDRLEPT